MVNVTDYLDVEYTDMPFRKEKKTRKIKVSEIEAINEFYLKNYYFWQTLDE